MIGPMGETVTPGQFLYRYAYCDDWFDPTWSDPLDRQDNWSPDLAERADEWAAWHERAEVQAELEAELEEYQRQMEATYQQQLYEEQWTLVEGGPWW